MLKKRLKPKNTGKNTGRLENLKPPWRKGQPSPNPKGRPKLSPLTEAGREWLNEIDPATGLTNAQHVAAALGKRARRGSPEAFRVLADRVEGKPKQAVEVKEIPPDEAPPAYQVVFLDGEVLTSDTEPTPAEWEARRRFDKVRP
jgi:hypothetical protein